MDLKNYFFLMNITTPTATTMAIIAPDIPIISIVLSPEEGERVNFMFFATFAPFTENVPEPFVMEYPDTLETVYEQVPLTMLNVMVVLLELEVNPLKVMFQCVPLERPVSVNVTVYWTFEKETCLETEVPFTVKNPGDDSYVLLVVAMVQEYVPLVSENGMVEVAEV